MEIHHVAVIVADLARAEEFYCGVLGLPVIRRWNDDAGVHRSTWVSLGAAFLAIERGTPSSGVHCLALKVPKVDREYWRARVSVERETAFTLYFRDPDGNGIALSHYPD